jgi:acetylornithine/N-succinyldiaminopimelate aminotransferase
MRKPSLTETTPFANNYSKTVLQLDRGEGVYLFDASGNRYLDFGSGIAVNAVGYGDPYLADVVANQMRKLVHVSNLYATAPAIQFGEALLTHGSDIARAPFTAVHFGNSGTEGNEAAIKYARMYSLERRGPDHHHILSFENAFHGRTMGALSATPKHQYRERFEPLVPGFDWIPFNDPDHVRRHLTDRYAAVLVEVIQGEGGLEVITQELVHALNEITAERDVLLIADEIQTGLGRTGYLFGSEMVGLKPDIVTLSKPLGGGLPLSATLLPAKVNDLLRIGDHGSTFGGGPVPTAAGHYLLQRLTAPGFLEHVRERALELHRGLELLQNDLHIVVGLRGAGLLRGVQIAAPSGGEAPIPQILEACRAAGLLVLRSGSDVVRIAPPLVITREELEEGLFILRSALKQVETAHV